MGECGAPGDVNSNVLVARSTGDAQLDKAVWQWLSWDKLPGFNTLPGRETGSRGLSSGVLLAFSAPTGCQEDCRLG